MPSPEDDVPTVTNLPQPDGAGVSAEQQGKPPSTASVPLPPAAAPPACPPTISSPPAPPDPMATAPPVPAPAGALPSAYATRDSPAAERPAIPANLLPAPRSSVPERVGDYDVLGELGRGGMGVVYRAVQRDLKRLVALKMILSGEHAGAQQLARFRAEAEAVARLRHPNIIQIYEIGEDNGRPFFSLEFADGGSLDRRVAGTPQGPALAARLVAVLARAMQAAHLAGVVHRDLKPANVLLALRPDAEAAPRAGEQPLTAFEPKITDFGLAKRLDADGGQTRMGDVLGTPSYMAPEQADGRIADVGPRTDVYALAAILYELLTGRPPFKGATAWDTVEQVRTQEPVPPSRLQPKLPRDLETVCLKGLHKDMARRYQSAAALADDLERWLDGRPILARRTGAWERGWKYARRKPWVVGAGLAAAAAVLFLVAGGGYYLYRQRLDLERELAHQKDLENIRAQDATAQGEEALNARKWRQAEAVANEVLARVGDEPALADLRTRALRLRDAAQKVIGFGEDRDKALFHAMLALEEGDRQVHREAAREAARHGLALFGLPGDGAAVAPRFGDGLFAPDVEQWLTQGCYELFLTWAEVLSPTPDEALRVLDGAKPLGLTTRSYYQRRAALLASLKRGDEARSEREQADALEPTLAVDHYLLGRALYGAGQTDAARAELKKVLREQPDHFWAAYCLAGCELRSWPPRYDRALEPLTACIKLNRDLAWPYILHGFASGQLRDFDTASGDFATADKMAADDITRYAVLVNRAVVRVTEGKDHDAQAEGLLRQGQAAKARPERDRATACYDAALPDLEAAAKLLPSQPQAYMDLAEVYRARKDWDKALPQLGRAIDLAPSASLYRTRASVYEKGQDFARALPDLEEAIRREQAPADSAALAGDQIQRGRILYVLKDYAAALEAFERAAAADPRRADADQLRGSALLKLGKRFDEAKAAYDRYLTKGAPTALVARGRGVARVKLGDYAGAAQDFTWALAMEEAAAKPTDPATLGYRGWAYIVLGSPKLALMDFEEALALNGGDRGDFYAGRGTARAQLGQWRPAVADADAALKETPLSEKTLYSAARIYAQAATAAQAGSTDSARLARQYERNALTQLGRACRAEPPEGRAKFWKQVVEPDFAPHTVARTAEFARMRGEFTKPVK